MSIDTTNIKAPSAPKTRTSRLRRILNNETVMAWLFILPSLIGFFVFYAYPALRGMYISLTDWDLLTDPSFIGFDNYAELFQDEDFWNALWVTVKYVLFNIPLQTALAIIIAVLMDRLTKSIIVNLLLAYPSLAVAQRCCRPPLLVATRYAHRHCQSSHPRAGLLKHPFSGIGRICPPLNCRYQHLASPWLHRPPHFRRSADDTQNYIRSGLY